MRIPVILIFGATATGKTDFALSLFAKNAKSSLANTCEIINADSIQVYKESYIASARPSLAECEKLPHHLVALKDGSEEFSVSDFVNEADRLSREIFKRNKIAVLMGGSAFFLKNFLYSLPKTPKADPELRKKLEQDLQVFGEEELFERLKLCDPKSATRIKKSDHYRVIRALEVYESSGKALSSFSLPTEFRNNYTFLILTLSRPREILYQRIEARVDKMFEAGLVEEFQKLFKKGYTRESPIMKAIGYSEFFTVNPTDPGNANIEEVKKLIKRNSRRYAKRQECFFKKIPYNVIVNLEERKEVLAAIEMITCFVKEALQK